MSSAAAADRGRPGPAPLPARPAPPRTLLLGMGNPILCDDGVGIRLARTPRPRGCGAVPGLVVRGGVLGRRPQPARRSWPASTGSSSLDSIKTADGTARRLVPLRRHGPARDHEPEQRPRRQLRHRAGARPPHGDARPRRDDIHIFAVEVDDNLTFGERLSPELEEAMPRLCEEMLARSRSSWRRSSGPAGRRLTTSARREAMR